MAENEINVTAGGVLKKTACEAKWSCCSLAKTRSRKLQRQSFRSKLDALTRLGKVSKP